MSLCQSLSREARALVSQSMDYLTPLYDEERGMVCPDDVYDTRPSMYYALGLLITDENPDRAEKIIHAVIDTQIDAPGEIFHGVYRHDSEPVPPAGVLDVHRLGLYGRYAADIGYERMADAFRMRLEHSALAEHAGDIEEMLRASLFETAPVVWSTYEPNSREFILMCFAMVLEHFETALSPETVSRIEKSCRLALEGAVERSRTGFTPLNTNIECMHVFQLDYFGTRLNIPEYRDYALAYARGMLKKYRELHAIAEFNSPTYCGVDLSTLGFWRRYGSNDELKNLGTELEEGIWQDVMAFYNPAMRNFCGPYSRAYELEQNAHTAFPSLFYLCAGEESYPFPPWGTESDSNTLLVLGDPRMPEDAKQALFAPKENVSLTRQFRELSERGDPDRNRALCTATAHITPNLMLGALSGSENPSHQLHPLVVFWRRGEELGTIKLLRQTKDGIMRHMHTVFFDGTVNGNHIDMSVRSDVRRDMIIFCEIECDGAASSIISENEWRLPGLTVQVSGQYPPPQVSILSGRIIQIAFPAPAEEEKPMRFSLDFKLNA